MSSGERAAGGEDLINFTHTQSHQLNLSVDQNNNNNQTYEHEVRYTTTGRGRHTWRKGRSAVRRVSRLERPLVRHVTSTWLRQAAQVGQPRAKLPAPAERKFRQNPGRAQRLPLILTLCGKMLLINNIDHQHL